MVTTAQITVPARECTPRGRFSSVGDTLAYRGQQWVVVGVFLGTDPLATEVEEYLILEQRVPALHEQR